MESYRLQLWSSLQVLEKRRYRYDVLVWFGFDNIGTGSVKNTLYSILVCLNLTQGVDGNNLLK